MHPATGAAPATPSPARPAAPLARLLAAVPGVLIVLAGLAWAWVHAPTLGAESFWTDELVSVGDATHDLIRMLKIQGADIHPPLHAFLLWILQRVTHDASEAAMRLPSLIAVTTGLTVLGLATWRRLGLWVALVALVLGLSSPLMGGFAAQARPHPLAFGFVCVATSAWLLMLRPGRPDRRLLAVFALAGMLAGLSQHYGALAFGLEATVLVGWLALQARALPARAPATPTHPGGRSASAGPSTPAGRSSSAPRSSPATQATPVRWADVRLAIVATALAVLPLVVWLAATRQWTHGSGTPPLTWPWAEEVVSWMLQPWSHAAFGWSTDEPRSIRAMAVVLGIAVTLLAIGLAVHRRGPIRDRLLIGTAALGLASAAIALAVGQSLVGSPTFHNRAILSLMPLVDIGFAVALTVPFGRFAPVAAVALAVVLGGSATQLQQVLLYGPLDQWREAAALIRDEQRAGLPADRVALVERYERDDWIVSLGNAYRLPAPVESLPTELQALHWVAGPADMAAIPTGSPLLLVAFHYYDFSTHAAIITATQGRFGPCTDRSLRGITILRCEGGPAGP